MSKIKSRKHALSERKLGACVALGCASLLSPAHQALAQDAVAADSTTVLRGVSVTEEVDEDYSRASTQSDKSTAPLVDTPQTVTVIPQQLIRDRGARSLPEVLRNTPGITFSAGENGFGTSANNFSLRGFDASGSVFIDNSRDSGSYTRDVFNVESVEVVKGAAADNGRGSTGGYVNLNTKAPTLVDFTAADISHGWDGSDADARQRASLDVNAAMTGSTAIRLNAVIEDSGVVGREVAKNKLWGIAPSVAFGLGSSLRGFVSWEHVERNDIPDWGVPGATMDLTGYDPSVGFNPLTEGAPRDAFYGLATDFDDSTSDAIVGRVEYDFSSTLTLSNQLRWNRVDRSARYTTPNGFTAAGQVVPTGTSFYARDVDTLSNLANLSLQLGSGAFSHQIAAGVELTREKSDADRLGAAVPAPGSTSVFNPNEDRVGAAPFNVTEVAAVKIDTQAVYVYDTFTLNDQWQLTGGLRGENYDVTLTSRTAAGAPLGSADGFSRSEFSVGGKLGVVFKPVSNASVYASAGSSVLPPGSYLSNPDISRTGDNAFPGLVPDAKNVRSLNLELGTKWDFTGTGLSATAAVFRSEKRNIPVVGRDVPGGDPAGTNTLQGYHKARVQGLELGLSGAITPSWQIFAGLLVSESERRISQELDDARRAGASGAGDYGTATSTNGDSLSFTPDFSASAWTTYQLPFGLSIGGGLQHVGSQFLGRPDDASRIIPNGRWGKLPSYTLVNALVSWDVNERIDVRFNVDNLLDKEYAQSANWAGSRATVGAQRSFLLSVGLQY